ncbi:MAG TPA: chorismate-binding protein, partial [Gemmataceae bacterium]
MQPDRQTYERLAREMTVVPVWVRMALDQETPVTVFRKLVGTDPGFLLESMAGGEDAGRFSIVGAQPRRSLVCTVDGAWIDGAEGRQAAPHNPFEALRRFVPRGVVPEGLRFAGGAVGYLGYDAVRHLERLPARPPADPPVPDAQFMECSLIAVLDHLHHQLTLIAPTRPAAAPSPDLALAEGRDRLQRALRGLRATLGGGPPLPLPEGEALGPGVDGAGFGGRVRSNLDRATFEAGVRRIKAYIEAGDAFQVVFSRRFEFAYAGDPFTLYRALRVINPSPYMFYLRFGDGVTLLGASPELLVRVSGRRALTRPLAGTRRRGQTPDEDRRLEAELLADEKERAEHMMLV